jgi:hypothetical protein
MAGFFIGSKWLVNPRLNMPEEPTQKIAILSCKNRYFVLYSVLFTVSQVHERFDFR